MDHVQYTKTLVIYNKNSKSISIYLLQRYHENGDKYLCKQ